jgi:hypothetical protein
MAVARPSTPPSRRRHLEASLVSERQHWIRDHLAGMETRRRCSGGAVHQDLNGGSHCAAALESGQDAHGRRTSPGRQLLHCGRNSAATIRKWLTFEPASPRLRWSGRRRSRRSSSPRHRGDGVTENEELIKEKRNAHARLAQRANFADNLTDAAPNGYATFCLSCG